MRGSLRFAPHLSRGQNCQTSSIPHLATPSHHLPRFSRSSPSPNLKPSLQTQHPKPASSASPQRSMLLRAWSHRRPHHTLITHMDSRMRKLKETPRTPCPGLAVSTPWSPLAGPRISFSTRLSRARNRSKQPVTQVAPSPEQSRPGWRSARKRKG
jgi:hypothetical protein